MTSNDISSTYTTKKNKTKREVIKLYLLRILLYAPFLYWIIVVLFAWVGSNFNMDVIRLASYVFLFYLSLITLSHNSAKWFFFQIAFLFFCDILFNIIGMIYILMNYLSTVSSCILTGLSLIPLIVYFYHKQQELSYLKLKKELIRARRVDFINALFYYGPGKIKINKLYNKKYHINIKLPESIKNLLRWLLLIACFVLPVAPYALRGIDQNKPLNYMMFFCILFFIWGLGYLTHMDFSIYKLLRDEEKKNGKTFRLACHQKF